MRKELLDYITENAVDGVCEVPSEYMAELVSYVPVEGTYDFMPSPPRREVQGAKIGFFSHAPAIYEYEYDNPAYQQELRDWQARKDTRRRATGHQALQVLTYNGLVEIKLAHTEDVNE